MGGGTGCPDGRVGASVRPAGAAGGVRRSGRGAVVGPGPEERLDDGRAGRACHPHRIQKFLGEASWSAEGLLAEVQAYVAQELGDPDATLVLDGTQVIKKGDRSVGVAHQHCGTTGDVRNCQVMVMLTYAAARGHTFHDRRLYLPQSWTGDRERCRAAGGPDDVAFATKPQLGIAMPTGAAADGLPFSWVAADADYGMDPALRCWLHERKIRYVLAVPSPCRFRARRASRACRRWRRPVICCTTPRCASSGSAAARARAPRGSAPTTGPGSRSPSPDRCRPTASTTSC
ncbi:IS701 family transposase [Streptomyces sp. NPDC002143]